MEDPIKKAVSTIRLKKELSYLSEHYVSEEVKEYLRKNPKVNKRLNTEKFDKSKEFKELIKAVRKDLRERYGMFILEGYQDKKSKEEALQSHKSTLERKDSYKYIYNKIFKGIGTDIKVYDLGCGMNPVQAPLIRQILGKDLEYYAFDIAQSDMEFLNNFFKEHNIKGRATQADLTKEKDYAKIKPDKSACNIFLLLKLADTLETIERQSSKKLIGFLLDRLGPKDMIVVSFPKTGISGRRNIHKDRRTWFENFIKKEKMKKEIIETRNEIFYLLTS